jgi:membrane protease YdiL (CAAX protease family)
MSKSIKIKIDKYIQALFPGVGSRPFLLAVLSTLCLVIYWHVGTPQNTPYWFVLLSAKILQINNLTFYLHLWAHTTAVAILLVVPIVISWLIGIRPQSLGFTIRHAKREFALILILWVCMLPIIWFVSQTKDFQAMYPRLPQAAFDMHLFILYEGFYLIKWIAWEFFFHGFMIFSFKKDIGNYAVLVSTIPFVLMHFGKPIIEVYASLFLGLLFCWIALRGRSFWPLVLFHWLIATSIDFFASTWWR